MNHAAPLARIADAIDAITAPLCADATLPRAMAVGCSGGLDSSVLLQAAHLHACRHGIHLHAFHVHHGLAIDADAWQTHVSNAARSLGIGFDARRIDVASNGRGIEGAARSGRYAALGAMCRAHGVPLLLTAHHQDDQAETVLLQLLRGSGVAGLSGMDACNTAPSLLGDPQLLMARPLLGFSRASLEQIANDLAIAHVQDPSNDDPRFARNALRHQVMPVLEASFPGFAQRFARSAQHAQAAQSLLITLAREDHARCSEDDCLLIDRLRGLDDARIDNLLRYWFGLRGKRMPSTAWLQQLRRQLFGAKEDAQILVGHPDCELHRHRNRIVMTARGDAPDCEQAPRAFQWDGSAVMAFPDYGGTLHFTPAEQGVDAAWLRRQSLALQWRSAGFRLKLAANRPTRSLKYHYQAAGIPAWERGRLPLVVIGAAARVDGLDTVSAAVAAAAVASDATAAAENEAMLLALGASELDMATPVLPPLLYAAGIGLDCQYLSTGPGEKLLVNWHRDRDQAD